MFIINKTLKKKTEQKKLWDWGQQTQDSKEIRYQTENVGQNTSKD